MRLIPKTTAQNLLLWGVALLAAILLSFLTGIATHWPENGVVDWRGVVLDVIQTITSVAPLVLAGLGLPALGKEAQAYLAHQVGQPTAVAALEQAATVQATSAAPTPEAADLMADQIMAMSTDERRALLDELDQRGLDDRLGPVPADFDPKEARP